MMHTASTTPPDLPRADSPKARRLTADDASLTTAARRLAEAARAFRSAAQAPREATDLARAFRQVEEALRVAAAGAELAADTVMDQACGGMRATRAAPSRAARSVSWRLHGLRIRLLAARDVCIDVNHALREVARD
jgi:hypothetical protein